MNLVNPQGYTQMLNSTATAIGPDWDTILTNPPDYPELGAEGCVVSQMLLQLTQPPNCTSIPVQSVTAVATEGGSVVLSYNGETISASQMTVSRMAAFPAGKTVTGQVVFPQLHDSFNIPIASTIFNNSLDAAAATGDHNASITRVQALASLGQTCNLSLKNVSCTATAQGTLQIAYQGWLWFNYHTPHTSGNETRYRWAEDVSSIPLELRSTYMTVSATISTHALLHDGGPQCRCEIARLERIWV
ncbi:hypothetical protein AURDEDRAFT_165633 [Auricularia subglabra TFB-10046 SS5]|nr:hypothetical protein AURDEDRAFT_165633 [Auricularia subglabra TFB-10046 SS5]